MFKILLSIVGFVGFFVGMLGKAMKKLQMITAGVDIEMKGAGVLVPR